MPYSDIGGKHEQGTRSGSCAWITTFLVFCMQTCRMQSVDPNRYMRILVRIQKVFVASL